MTDNQLTESWDKVFQASQQAIDYPSFSLPPIVSHSQYLTNIIFDHQVPHRSLCLDEG